MVTADGFIPEHCFIHIPKTGGTSIEHGLLAGGHWADYGFEKFNEWNWRCGYPKTPEFRRKHVYLWTHIRDKGYAWCDSSILFTMVRNPWARYVSQYHFRRHVRHGDSDPERIQSLTFDQWCNIRIDEESAKLNTAMKQHSWLEHDAVVDPCIDYIGRTETIADDWKTITKMVGRTETPELPHKLKMTYGNYKTFYSPELRDRVGEFAHQDCVAFGYDFDGVVGPGTARVGTIRNERRRNHQESA